MKRSDREDPTEVGGALCETRRERRWAHLRVEGHGISKRPGEGGEAHSLDERGSGEARDTGKALCFFCFSLLVV